MMKSSPTVSKAVKEAMERMESGQSDPKPERKPSKPYSLYGGLGYDRVMEMQKAGQGFGNYSAIVGPTIIYGRRVELGGGNWPAGTKFPYMKPAWEKFRPLALGIIRKHLAL